uniref:Serpin domain-containing protein n=1 Tax=Ditylenchus dipsaci TaxID=166011 RepID=A0A915D8K3_9BILA
MSHVNKVHLEFALDLLRRTTLNSPTKSVVICPVTIANSLAILSYGCRGKTADKLQKALGYVEDDYYFYHYFSGIAKVLCDGSVENMLKIANRLYVPKEFDVMESFQNFVTEKYSNQAHLIDLDSLDEATLKLLNHTSMTLINAVHFEGLWHVYFDASETKKELFHVSKTLSRELSSTMSARLQESDLLVERNKRGRATVYSQLEEFPDEEDFNRWFLGEKSKWKIQRSRNYEKHRADDYLCRYGQMTNYQCKVKLRVLYPQNSLKTTKFLEEDKELMRQNLGSTALNLQRKIQDTHRNERDSLPPSIKQIQNFKCRQNKSQAIVSLEQLKAYAIRNAAVPEEDENKTFVCGFASSVISEKIVFCLTWTTVKLRRFQQQSKMIQVDATYKLSWHGFPVLVCGFSDSSQHFCGTFLALSSNENTWCYERFFVAVSSCTYVPELLMGDGDKTISAAAVNFWGSIKRAMCFAHVKMNLTKKLRPKTWTTLFKLFPRTLLFYNSLLLQMNLTEREWQTRYAGQYRILEVCAYFSKEWIDSPLNGWFEGFSPYASTNNGLESKNGLLKKITFRKKLSVNDFLLMVEKTMNLWSVQPENQVPSILPSISPSLYQEAYRLKQENRSVLDVLVDGVKIQCHIIPSSSAINLDKNILGQMYNELQAISFIDWKRYKLILKSLRIIRPSSIWPSYEVTMMHKNFTFEYYEDELLQRVNLYCKDEELKMYILLPKQPEKLSEIIQQMSSERFRNIVRPNRPPIYHIDHDHLDFVDLKLPKFSIDSTHDLLPILQQIPTYRTCIEQVSTKSADFNGLTSSPNELCLGQMVQRAVIEICEEECQEKGTWTIPLTRVKTRGDARPPQHHNFHANHPFIFFLADNNYHIFMSGVVGDDQH